MYDVTDAQSELIEHLQGMPDRPSLSYPGGPGGQSLPRMVVQIPSPAQRTINLQGTAQIDAEISVRVETKDGEFDTESRAIVKKIIAHFADAGQLSEQVTIIDRPRVGSAYSSGGVYHVPVTIRGRTYC